MEVGWPGHPVQDHSVPGHQAPSGPLPGSVRMPRHGVRRGRHRARLRNLQVDFLLPCCCLLFLGSSAFVLGIFVACVPSSLRGKQDPTDLQFPLRNVINARTTLILLVDTTHTTEYRFRTARYDFIERPESPKAAPAKKVSGCDKGGNEGSHEPIQDMPLTLTLLVKVRCFVACVCSISGQRGNQSTVMGNGKEGQSSALRVHCSAAIQSASHQGLQWLLTCDRYTISTMSPLKQPQSRYKRTSSLPACSKKFKFFPHPIVARKVSRDAQNNMSGGQSKTPSTNEPNTSPSTRFLTRCLPMKPNENRSIGLPCTRSLLECESRAGCTPPTCSRPGRCRRALSRTRRGMRAFCGPQDAPQSWSLTFQDLCIVREDTSFQWL